MNRHGSFTVVMATGIVSVAAAEHDLHSLSLGLWAIAIVLYLVIGVHAAEHLRVSIDSFAFVAATSVLGTRFAMGGQRVAALVLAGFAATAWCLIWLRLRTLGPTTASRLLAALATQSVGVDASSAVAWVAVVLLTLGLVFYCVLVVQLPLAHLRHGAGDIWIAMGALAISALAAADLSSILGSPILRAVTLVTWVGASCWIPVLLIAEVRWRRLHYDPKRWSSVFPLGMYAVSTHAAGHILRLRLLLRLSDVCLWVAVRLGSSSR